MQSRPGRDVFPSAFYVPRFSNIRYDELLCSLFGLFGASASKILFLFEKSIYSLLFREIYRNNQHEQPLQFIDLDTSCEILKHVISKK